MNGGSQVLSFLAEPWHGLGLNAVSLTREFVPLRTAAWGREGDEHHHRNRLRLEMGGEVNLRQHACR